MWNILRGIYIYNSRARRVKLLLPTKGRSLAALRICKYAYILNPQSGPIPSRKRALNKCTRAHVTCNINGATSALCRFSPLSA